MPINGVPTMPAPAVIELRQYTLHPGQRDALIALFEREFVESQEAAGMHVLGTFRDLDDPDRFVWLRGFDAMAGRADALGRFYGGPVWQAHRDAANATIADSDNVFLLPPAGCDQGLAGALRARDGVPTESVYTIAVCPLRETPGDAQWRAFDQCIHPWAVGVGGDLLACWVSESAPNDFPRLPVREGEPVLAWLTRFDNEAAQRRHAALLHDSGCLDHPEWRRHLAGDVVHVRLAPTPRSALR
jgi:quinol monooxygenase YgiN